MRRIIFVTGLIGLAACSSPAERTRCTTTADCRAGEFCAHTGDGSVCWADDVAPTFSWMIVGCDPKTQDGACARDAHVGLTVRVRDDQQLETVTAAIATSPDKTFRLTQKTVGGSDWEGHVPLAAIPFPSFEGDVVVTVKATDAAGNATTAEAPAPLHVSRLRWTFDAGRPLSPPAVTMGGTVVMGRADSAGQAIGVNDRGEEVFRLTLGNADVVAAPTTWVGTWFASTGGTLYRVAYDDVNNRYELKSQCATGAPMSAAPTLYFMSGEFAIAGNDAGSLYVDNEANVCNQTAAGGAVRSPAVVSPPNAYVVAGSALRSFNVLAGGAMEARWASPPLVGSSVAAPAIDSAGNVWTASALGQLRKTTPAGASEDVASVGAEVNGIVILSDDTAVIGDDSGKLKRLGAGAPWSETAVLAGTPSAPIALAEMPYPPVALAGNDPVLLTGTSIGWLYAIRQSDGAILWSQKLGSGALRIGTVVPFPGDLPTAYLPSSDGKLYAVVVDGDLDASAPWPKPYHDAQNTGNMGTLPRW